MEFLTNRKYFLLITLCIATAFNDFFDSRLVESMETYIANLIAYSLSIIIFVVPFLVFEFAMYNKYNCEIPKIYKNLEHRWEIFGWVKIISNLAIGLNLITVSGMLGYQTFSYLNKINVNYNFQTSNEVLQTMHINEFPNFYLGQGFNFILFIILVAIWIVTMLFLKRYNEKTMATVGVIILLLLGTVFSAHILMKFIVSELNFDLSAEISRNIKLLFSKEGVNIWYSNFKAALLKTAVAFSAYAFVSKNKISKENILKDALIIALGLIVIKIYMNLLFIDAIKFLIFRGYNVYNLGVGQIFVLVANLLSINSYVSNILVLVVTSAIIISKCLFAFIIFKTFLNAVTDKCEISEDDLINILIKLGIVILLISSSIFGYNVILTVIAKYNLNYVVMISILVETIYVGRNLINEGILDDIIENKKLKNFITIVIGYLMPTGVVFAILKMAFLNMEFLHKNTYNVVIAEVFIGCFFVIFVFAAALAFYRLVWYKKYKV